MTYDRLLDAVTLRSEDGAIRISAEYEPIGGPGDKLFPPTAKLRASDAAGYLVEPRYVNGERVEVVCLDQPQSQANRCELALAEAIRDGSVYLPHLLMATESQGASVRMTNLDAPHRSRDAYFRDSEDAAGTKFDDTETGLALRQANAGDLSAYLRQAPSDLVFGTWDSHRKRRIQTKIARAYTSYMFGVAPLKGVRAAGRVDTLNLPGDTVQVTEGGWSPIEGTKAPKGAKTAKMSELGHGMIPPTEGLGGVSVQAVHRTATVSLAQFATLRFGGADAQYTAAARALLASIALLGDRLAFAAPALRLRSGCDLVLVSEQVQWVQRGTAGRPSQEVLELSTPEQALALFAYARKRAQAAGVEWAEEPVVVKPTASLQQAIDRSYASNGAGAAESE
ncbi:type I-U CRISPR-associated RAMP protein Csb1/Cas7u [Streptomyces sp. NPDC087532]|uniref:type I-G CRISPR-associated RAMP protein Csb1/Cas7g n=1 Tax=unclassified Streptomyces TaxID=2593676 RepID=UPI0033187B00